MKMVATASKGEAEAPDGKEALDLGNCGGMAAEQGGDSDEKLIPEGEDAEDKRDAEEVRARLIQMAACAPFLKGAVAAGHDFGEAKVLADGGEGDDDLAHGDEARSRRR